MHKLGTLLTKAPMCRPKLFTPAMPRIELESLRPLEGLNRTRCDELLHINNWTLSLTRTLQKLDHISLATRY